ncbi:chloride channel protein [Spelaeicoccus albus]|uniref:CIC family chloride channel protein n=1 Tax=Spelaeicoccus albus TaxID=1280376 RepID=A0A7Z0AAE8_9MICO|nr:chloride channel protein [Spelaeicoccus albus]NYI66495.1 CIC family chloride channel protein [Spelaeicoccus albus]
MSQPAPARPSRWEVWTGRLGFDKRGDSAVSMHMVLPALVIGLGAGLAAVGFRWLITAATWVFTGTADYSATNGHPANQWVPGLGAVFVIFAPAVGGLIYGPLVHLFAREARGHGVPEVMYAVNKRGGRIRGSVAVVKALASAICIGSGGSVGREGPIAQIGSALGSAFARLLRLPESSTRTLVACGAAGGIAATFNAPIAGVFFALELLLLDFAASSFGAVVLSSITASVIGRAFLGDHAFLQLPKFTVASPWEYFLFAVLGLVAGFVGVGFTKVLYLIEDVCDWAWRAPEWLRPVAGGILLGLLLFALPQLYGVGYPVLENGVNGKYAIGLLLLLLVGKIVATSLTIGVGGSGGVFAPSLFVGAMLGAAFGDIVGAVIPSLAGQTGAFALVGMGAVFAGSARAPITAALIIFEITGEYSVIIPLLLAIIISTAMSRMLTQDTIYTLKLRRRGVDINSKEGDDVLRTITVSKVMVKPPPALGESMSARAGADLIISSGRLALPVHSDSGEFIGVIDTQVVSDTLATDDDADERTVGDLCERPRTVGPETTLETALDAVMSATGGDGVPVVNDNQELVGWLRQDSILKALTAARNGRS